MTPQTPGQAAYEALHESITRRQPAHMWVTWDVMSEINDGIPGEPLREDLEAAAQAAIDHYRDNRADWPDEGDLAEIASRAVEQEQAAMAGAASQELAAAMCETRQYRAALMRVREALVKATDGSPRRLREALALVNAGLEGR